MMNEVVAVTENKLLDLVFLFQKEKNMCTQHFFRPLVQKKCEVLINRQEVQEYCTPP